MGALQMPTVKLYRNGLTMGAGGNAQPVGGKRGVVDGWSRSAVRRHTRWLYSVNADELSGIGYAVTLTLADCPPSEREWTRLRREWTEQLTRSGLVLRSHWVVEWTRRKVPHIHAAVYVPAFMTHAAAESLIVGTWLRLAGPKYGSADRGQHLGLVSGPLGWLEYLSKHASRGVNHYQRQGKPEGWEKTGRLWGHTGSWPLEDAAEGTLSHAEFYRFRRLVRAWRVANARAALAAATASVGGREREQAARRGLVTARRMLQHPDRDICRVRGVSEWIPEGLGLALLLVAAGDGEGALAASREAGARALPAPRPQRVTTERW